MNSSKINSEDDSLLVNDNFSVLLVDDDSNTMEILNDIFEDYRFLNKKLTIDQAKSFDEAKLKLTKNRYSIGIFDVVMDKKNAGLELVQYIRADLSNTIMRIIVHTGQAANFPKKDVIDKYDIDNYLDKGQTKKSDVIS